jgi:RNA polymerase sigma-70 factor, ECF subfamily
MSIQATPSPRIRPESTSCSSTSTDLEALFCTYYRRLCTFAEKYVGSPDVAEEVVADVFLRVWARNKCQDESGCPKRYLYVAVRNQALKYLDHQRVVRRWQEVAKEQVHVPGMGQPPADAEALLHAVELAAAVQDAVEHLPTRCRQAYTLHRQEGLSYTEIATLMGTSARTVETQLARAAKALRRDLAVWLP